VRRSDQGRTENEDMEMQNELDGENLYSPKRQKKQRTERSGEKTPERTRSRTRALYSKTVYNPDPVFMQARVVEESHSSG
jgi:hypothetical protein